MTKRRTLLDLYVVGRNVRAGDGLFACDPDSGEPIIENGEKVPLDPVKVWLQKLSPNEFEIVYRKGLAARSAVLARSLQPDSEMYREIQDQIILLNDRELYAIYLAADEMADLERAEVIAAEIEGAPDSEWAKDGYLQGLRDAWDGGLGDRYEADNNDAEAASVNEELARLNAEVAHVVQGERESRIAAFLELTTDDLIDRMTKVWMKSEAAAAQLDAHNHWLLSYAIRKPDNHRQRLHPDVDDIIAMDQRVRNQLLVAYKAMAVDGAEGKESRAAESSSSLSEPAATAATSVPSGPVAADT